MHPVAQFRNTPIFLITTFTLSATLSTVMTLTAPAKHLTTKALLLTISLLLILFSIHIYQLEKSYVTADSTS